MHGYYCQFSVGPGRVHEEPKLSSSRSRNRSNEKAEIDFLVLEKSFLVIFLFPLADSMRSGTV